MYMFNFIDNKYIIVDLFIYLVDTDEKRAKRVQWTNKCRRFSVKKGVFEPFLRKDDHFEQRRDSKLCLRCEPRVRISNACIKKHT